MALQLYSSSGEAIHLGDKLGAPGGEGTVYEVQSRANYAAKIYHEHILRNHPEKPAKLQAMASVKTDRLVHLSAWPVETLHIKPRGPVAGFMMPRALGYKDVHMLYGVKTRKAEYPEARWPFLLHAASNVARAFQVIHEHGHVIGDVNHGGVLVSNKATVMLVDCDSFQVAVNGRRFLCNVGISTHTPPELQGHSFQGVVRTPNHDAFGLAVIIFQLLFLGRHPFSGTYLGRGDMPIERAIKEYRFAYGSDASSRMMNQPPGSLPFNAISEELRALFRRAFLPPGNLRPPASDWITPLSQLGQNLKPCQQNNGHNYLKTLTRCPWCDVEFSSGTAVFYPIFVGVTPGLAGFNIVAVWAQVEAIPAPTNLGTLPNPSSIVISPSALTKRLQRWRFVRDAAITLGVAVVCLFLLMSPLSAGLTFLAIVGFGLVTIPLFRIGESEHTKQLRTAKVDSEHKLKDVQRRWQAASGQVEFHSKKKELEKKKSEYEGLPHLLQSKLDALKRHVRELQLERYLDSFRIDKANISNIGHARKITLRSYGVETAADISMRSILAIPGFGPVYASNLVAWRHSIETKFRFDPNRGVDGSDKQAVHREIANARTKLQQELQNGLVQLRQISTRVNSSNVLLRQHMEAALTAAAQARSDFAVGVGTPKRFVPTIIFLFVAIVSIVPLKGGLQIPTANRNSSPAAATPRPTPQSAPTIDSIKQATDEYERGIALTKAGRFGDAANAYREAVALNPDYQQAYHELGYALYRMHKYEEALKATSRSISLNSSDAESYRNRALIYEAMNRWSDAAEAYNDALQIEPNHAPTYFAMGRCLRSDGKISGAISAYRQAVKIKPNFANAHYELALTYAAAGQNDQAWAEYNELLRLNEQLAEKLYAQLNQE